MDDDDNNLDWINCPHCEDVLYLPETRFFWPRISYFFGEGFRRDPWRDFFCVKCCDFIDGKEIVGREFNGVSVGGGDGYRTWRASNGDETIFAGKLKIFDVDSNEWKIFLRALGIEPNKLGLNLNFETEDDGQPLIIGMRGGDSDVIRTEGVVGIATTGESFRKTKDGKKVVYIDMDSVLVDFKHALIERGLDPDMDDADDIGGLFSEMVPLEGAIEAFETLRSMKKFDVYILSTAPWNNPSAWYDKLQWVKRYLGDDAKKRLILSHRKDLNWGTYLIDDRPNNGAKEFGEIEGQQWIHFGSDRFPDWQTTLDFLQNEV